ncbi:class I SAM-dependent methyltransferase [Mycolicibacterium holsaticum DSM 44478 = JCM 12374]|nr:class I SAM-dependent methyltransferase [Mycolicibacterium holsaticum DSM 44478 = JCM 12374]UNC10329.1 class I SAM-dependent methyltransferase [Mycolicibacterium holsaticum DSM 44478 = JCM 12374]
MTAAVSRGFVESVPRPDRCAYSASVPRQSDRYIPDLYSRDINVYEADYQEFIRQALRDLRQCKISGHTLLWEASQLQGDGLLLDLGVWIGWSTRLLAEKSGRRVYGFDTFEGLVEDWQIDDQKLIRAGALSIAEPFAQRLIEDTGVTIEDGIPAALGRDVQFVRGSTYDTLAPFLDAHPGPIRLFHMDLDTYDSCLHALETCKERFTVGSILVFDEYLVTNGEMRAFYEFQNKYDFEFRYRAWGLEIMEMNVAMVTDPVKRLIHHVEWFQAQRLLGVGSYVWKMWDKRFWRFWLGAPWGDIRFMLGAVGQRKSVSLEITGLGRLGA